MKLINTYIIKLLLIFVIVSTYSFGRDVLEIRENQPGTMILEFNLDSLWISTNKGKAFTNPKLIIYQKPGYPQIPYYKEVLVGVPSNADIQVYSSDPKTVGQCNLKINNEDIVKLSSEIVPEETNFTGQFPLNQVTLSQTIDVNGQPASIIEIFPVDIDYDKISFHENITIHLNWNVDQSSKISQKLSSIKFEDIIKKDKVLSKDYSVSIPDYQYSSNITKIVIDTTGWYGITQDALVDSGIDIKKIDPSTIRLWNKEDEVLVYVEGYEDNSFDKNDQIIFYGEKTSSPEGAPYDNNFYTNENVYWLTWGDNPGKRYLNESVYPSLPTSQVFVPQRGTYRYTEKIEYDDLFLRIPDNNVDEQWDIMDHFFMDPSINPGETVRFPFVLPQPDRSSNSTYDLKVNVQGISRNNHDVEIKINERLATEGGWFGQTAFEISSDPDESLKNEFLSNDTNYISIDLSGESPNQRFDQIYLNWFEITYDKLYNAFNNYIKFNRDKSLAITTQFNIENFSNSDIYLFKEGVSRLRDFVVEQQSKDEFEITFQDFYGENSPYYHAFTEDQLRIAQRIIPQTPIERKLNEIQSNYIAIAPDSFQNTLKPLINSHNGEFVDIDEIYRQYSHGILSPYAIRSFLRDVYFTNSTLKYVLIGLRNNDLFRASKNFFEINFIPSMQMIAKEYGAVVSDYWYACLDDDLFPEISVGRFPVANEEELERIVSKSVAHINRNTLIWDNNILFIGGLEEKFKEQSELLLDEWVKTGNFISRLYIDQSSEKTSFYGTTDTLTNHLNRGISYINFVGHGGGAVWGDRSILGISDIDDVENGNRLPFVTSMTCFTGDYSNPNSLGSKMLTLEDGGAIAWYGSAGKGWIGNDYLLIDPLNQLLSSNVDMTFGEMINLSKYLYYIYNQDIVRRSKTMLYQYNMVGDPALKLKRYNLGSSTIEPNNPEAGEVLQIDLQTSSADSVYYQFYYPFTDSIEIVIDEDSSIYQYVYYDNFSVNQPAYLGQSNSISFALPEILENGIHNFNLSYKDGNDITHVNNSFGVKGSQIEIVNIIPEKPNYLETIQVQAKVFDTQGIESVKLFIDSEYWSDMVNVSENLYELVNPIPPQPPSTYIKVNIEVIDGNGNVTISESKNIFISTLPNIFPKSLEFTVDDEISLTAAIENSKPAKTVANVKLFIKNENNWNLIGGQNIDFDGRAINLVNFEGFYPNGENEYRVISQSDKELSLKVDDTLEVVLPTEYFWVTTNLGSTADGINNTSVGNDIVSISIEPQKVETDQIIAISNIIDLSNLSQPDFEIVKYNDKINLIDITWDSSVSYYIEWSVPEPIIDPVKIYKFYSDYSTWLPVSNVTMQDNGIKFNSDGSGIFAFLSNDDIDPPLITASVNGQKYLANSYLNDTPVFSFNVYDENGVDFRSDSIQTLINDLAVDDIISNINGGVGNLGIEISPNLTESDSILSLIVQDAAGNQADTMDLKFIVSNELKLIDYGNYPNPFIDNTKFAYELSETVDELSFIIYSVEGRRIRKLTRLESLTELELELGGYHELNWNGSNDTENIVDNGTYFYMIRAKKGKEVIERTGKIVRAK